MAGMVVQAVLQKLEFCAVAHKIIVDGDLGVVLIVCFSACTCIYGFCAVRSGREASSSGRPRALAAAS